MTAVGLASQPARALDPTFGSATPGVVRFEAGLSNVRTGGVAVLADGSVVVDTVGYMRRFTSAGVADPTFGGGSNGVVSGGNGPADLVVDASNRIVAGITNTSTSLGQVKIAQRFSASGIVDAGFDGTVPGAAFFGTTTVVDVSSGVVVSSSGNGQACLYRFRSADGVLDSTFGSGGSACVPEGADPKTVAIGARESAGSFVLVSSDGKVVHLSRFSSQGVQSGTTTTLSTPSPLELSDVAATAAGFVITGSSPFTTPPTAWAKAFTAAGQPDPTFAASGNTPSMVVLDAASASPWSIVPLQDGRLLVAGAVSRVATARLLTADGRSDRALEPNSVTPGVLRVASPTGELSSFIAATVADSRAVVVGQEHEGFSSQWRAIVARSETIGTSMPGDTALLRPTAPTRVLDTRPGPDQTGYAGAKPGAGATVDVQLAGVAGLPATGIGAVVMNLTATEASAPGFVTAWPSGSARPVVSSLNLERVGQTLPNLVIVPVGANGRVSLFTQSGTHLIADLLGWFPSTGSLHTVEPARLLETRPGPDQTGYTGPKPQPGATVRLQVSGRAGLPSTGVEVALLNITTTETDAAGFVTVFPSGLSRPLASSLNVAGAGQTIQNLVVAPVGSDGAVQIYTLGGGHLIADVVGWLGVGSGYVATPLDRSPRLLDTREGARVAPAGTARARVSSQRIQLVNVVAVDAVGPGFFTVWPAGATRPLASNLNVEFAGQTIANAVLVSTNTAGEFDIFTQSGAHIVVDSVGSFPIPADG